MKLEKLINQFNTANTHLVVSRWPSKAGAGFDGIATYTEDTLKNFVKTSGARFVVFAEQQPGEKEYEVVDKNILVLRIFNPHRHSLFPTILTWLRKFSAIKQVVVHSEFCASGGPHMRLLMVPFLLLIKLTRREVVLYAHNVVDQLDAIAQHLNLESNSFKLTLFSAGLRLYYRLLGVVVDTFVVLEDVIGQRLARYTKKPISVQYHWVKPYQGKITKKEARKRLGLPLKKNLVLSFGFVTYYKGADWFANVAKKAATDTSFDNTLFVLAGGEAYSLKDEQYYKQYYQTIKHAATTQENLLLTGFIPSDQIKLWLLAADTVVFPYRELIGGSGALQQALKYNCTILQSKPMLENMYNGIIHQALEKSGLTAADVQFPLHSGHFLKKLKSIQTDPVFAKKLKKYATTMQKQVSFEKLVPQHYQTVFFQPQTAHLNELTVPQKLFRLAKI